MPTPQNAAEGYCPYCHKYVMFLWVVPIAVREADGLVVYRHTPYIDKRHLHNAGGYGWAMAECPSCHNLVLVQLQEQYIDFEKQYVPVRILPNPLPSPTDEHIPEQVRSDLDEAKAAFSVGAYRATVVMCRRALQSAAIIKGASKRKKLKEQINELYELNVITEDLRNLAHAIRLIGNEGAHPDPENPEIVTREDAEELLQFTEQLLHVLFVAPAKVKELLHSKGAENNLDDSEHTKEQDKQG